MTNEGLITALYNKLLMEQKTISDRLLTSMK